MKKWLKIAFRNTLRQKKRAFLLGGAIAFGFMVITLLNGFTSGLVVSVKDNFSGIFGGHIFISGEEVSSQGSIVGKITDSAVLDKVTGVYTDKIKQVICRSAMAGNIIFGPNSTIIGVDGIDYVKENQFFKNMEFTEGSAEDSMAPGSIILPGKTAEKLGIKLGESILFSTSTVTGQSNVGEFIVRGITRDQESFGISSAYASIKDVNDLIGLPENGFISYNLYLNSMEEMNSIADEIYAGLSKAALVAPRIDTSSRARHEDDGPGRSAMGGMFQGMSLPQAQKPWKGTKYRLTTINELMTPLMSLVKVLNSIGFVVFIILIVITMVGIMNTYRMVMIERTGEIGTMRAIGVQRKGIRLIFIWEAGIVAFAGAIAGLVLAAIIILVLNFFSFSGVPALSFFLKGGKINFSIIPLSVIGNFLLIVLLSLMAAYLPARAAAKLEPAQALRKEY